MKKLILTIAIVSQALFVFAEKPKTLVRVKNENVKLYLQPGTAAPVLKSLSSDGEIKYVRPYNNTWSIVMVKGQVGYVLTSELYSDHGEMPTVKTKKGKKTSVAKS